MSTEHLSLPRQIDTVFRELKGELRDLRSGIVFVQIRNNTVGKFGIRHDPIESKDGALNEMGGGLTELQWNAFAKLGVQALQHKKYWTHGEIYYEFAIKKDTLITSIQIESNYNMANLPVRK